MSKPSEVKAVAFDLDGLMFNTEELYDLVGARFLNRRGHQLNQELVRQMMGRPAKVAIPLMIDWYGLKESVEEVQTECDALFDEILPTRLRPMAGLLELLNDLEKKEIPRSITTSSRRSFLDKLLRLSKLQHEFEFFLTSECISNGKPHPEIYQMAASRFGIVTEQMVVFEDSENGCRAAVAAGCIAVAVPTEKSRSHSFEGAKLVCESLQDVRILQLLSR